MNAGPEDYLQLNFKKLKNKKQKSGFLLLIPSQIPPLQIFAALTFFFSEFDLFILQSISVSLESLRTSLHRAAAKHLAPPRRRCTVSYTPSRSNRRRREPPSSARRRTFAESCSAE